MIIKEIIKSIWRFPIRQYYKNKLKNHNFTLISANCIGGGYYHDTYQQFLSPTINLTVSNFISFVERLDYYLGLEMLDGGINKSGHPVGLLDDVSVCGVHYPSFVALAQKWNERKSRVNFSNLFIIVTEEFIKTNEDKNRFDNINYPKVCFVSRKEDVEYNWQVYLPGYEQCEQLGDSMTYCDVLGRRVNEKYFDFIYFLNNKQIKARGK